MFKPNDIVGPDDDEMIDLGHIGKVIHCSGENGHTIWTCKICGYCDDWTNDLRKVK